MIWHAPTKCAPHCCDEEEGTEQPPNCEELDCFGDRPGWTRIRVGPPTPPPTDPYNPRTCIEVHEQLWSQGEPISDVYNGWPDGYNVWPILGQDMTAPCVRKWVFETPSAPFIGDTFSCSGGIGSLMGVEVKRLRIEVYAGTAGADRQVIMIHEVLEVLSVTGTGTPSPQIVAGDLIIGITVYQIIGAAPVGYVAIPRVGHRIVRERGGIRASCGDPLTLPSVFCTYPSVAYMEFCKPCEVEFWIEDCKLHWNMTNGWSIIIERIGAHWMDGGPVFASRAATGSFPLEPGQKYKAGYHCTERHADLYYPVYDPEIYELDPVDDSECFIPCNTNCSPDWGLSYSPRACYGCGCHRGQVLSVEMRVWNVRNSGNKYKSCPPGTGGAYTYLEYSNWGILNGSWAWVPVSTFNGIGWGCNETYEAIPGEAIYKRVYRNPVIGNGFTYEPLEWVQTVWHQFRIMKMTTIGRIQYRTRAQITRGGTVESTQPYTDDWFNLNLSTRQTTGPQTDEHCGVRFGSNDHTVSEPPEVCHANGLLHIGGITSSVLIQQDLLMTAYGSIENIAYVENPLCP